MWGSPRVIAIDDDPQHLRGLVDCLNRQGTACHQLHFTGDPSGVTACPDVRIIFADLHLGMGTPSDHKSNFSMIGGLLQDTIKPSGPYFIILWTQFPEQAEALRAFLDRLETDVTKPFDVLSLPKADHLGPDGSVKNEEALLEAIEGIPRESTQFAALLDWERRVLRATGRTVSSILELAAGESTGERPKVIGRVLSRLAIEAVGPNNVEADPLRAVNEALLPILADRISALRSSSSEQEIWSEALEPVAGLPTLSLENTARLNSLVHIADPDAAAAAERGIVAGLPSRYRRRFDRCFGITEEQMAAEEFRCTQFDKNNDRFCWVLVQCEAACDHAQARPRTLPFYLGLVFPTNRRNKKKKPPASTWRGPPLRLRGNTRVLRVSARFPVALPQSYSRRITPMFRLREQILNELTYHIHTHGARPGMIAFRE